MSYFDYIWKKAEDSIERNEDARASEHTLVICLSYIISHPEIKSVIESKIVKIIENGATIPHELIGFCMHELRWPKVFDAARRRRDREANNPHGQRLSELIMESYSDDWDGRVIYEYYQNKRSV
jgi:hypothetical protein